MNPEAPAARAENDTEPFFLKAFRIGTSSVGFILCFLGFVIQLGGVGDSNSKCDDSGLNDCEGLFRTHWWATFYHAILCVIIGVLILFGIIKDVSTAACTFLGIGAIQQIYAADEYLDYLSIEKNMFDDDTKDSLRAATTGYIFSIMGTFLLIISIGITGKPMPVMPKPPAFGAPGGPTRRRMQQPNAQSPAPAQSNAPPPPQPFHPAKVVNP